MHGLGVGQTYIKLFFIVGVASSSTRYSPRAVKKLRSLKSGHFSPRLKGVCRCLNSLLGIFDRCLGNGSPGFLSVRVQSICRVGIAFGFLAVDVQIEMLHVEDEGTN